VRERHAHVLLDGVGRQQRLRVHGVEVLDSVAKLDFEPVLADRAPHSVVQHDTAQ
jgi:hypothetical protein